MSKAAAKKTASKAEPKKTEKIEIVEANRPEDEGNLTNPPETTAPVDPGGAPPVVATDRTAEVTQIARQPQRLAHKRLDQVEFIRNEWAATPLAGIHYLKLLEPEFWAHVASKFKIGDKIEVVPDDASYYMELMVLDVGPAFAKVALLRHKELEAVDPRDELAGIKIEWNGRVQKYRVRRGDDILSHGHATQSGARQWAEQYVKQISK